MKYTFLLTLSIIFLITPKIYSQARSSVSIGYGINKPFSGDYNSGNGIALYSSIALGDKWSVVPAIGYESIKSKFRAVYNSEGFVTKRINSLDLFNTGVSARYSFDRQWFAKAGPILYAAGGNEDVDALGIGGTAAADYNLNLDRHNTLEFSLLTIVFNNTSSGNGITPAGGFKVAYTFNFKGVD